MKKGFVRLWIVGIKSIEYWLLSWQISVSIHFQVVSPKGACLVSGVLQRGGSGIRDQGEQSLQRLRLCSQFLKIKILHLKVFLLDVQIVARVFILIWYLLNRYFKELLSLNSFFHFPSASEFHPKAIICMFLSVILLANTVYQLKFKHFRWPEVSQC